MSKYLKGILGSFSGLVGSVVGATWNGIDVMRSRPRKSSKPPTLAQMKQRDTFALMRGFSREVSDIIRIGFQAYHVGQTPDNAAFGLNIVNAVTGGYPSISIDYPEFVLSKGNLLDAPEIVVATTVDAQLDFSWLNNADVADPLNTNSTDKVALVVNWIKPLWSVINLGYQVFKNRKTPLNAAIGYHMKEAVKGEAPDFEIEFSKAIFSVGELLLSLITEMVALGDGMLCIKWNNIAESVYNSGSDRAIFIVYNPDKQQFVSFVYSALRADRQAVLQLPDGFAGDAVHCYLFFASEKGDKVSTSQYLGEVVVV
ncbi:DUF6266 family protein [Pedobacter ginsengisoli]|uniref:DUF6266 family protein n=1 Tax=Pedobacter ginsengisoli TaxID=363852 RepID=UPI00254E0EF5|nr:DUF6266 family protein [Pedobacter ginsengisoli]